MALVLTLVVTDATPIVADIALSVKDSSLQDAVTQSSVPAQFDDKGAVLR